MKATFALMVLFIMSYSYILLIGLNPELWLQLKPFLFSSDFLLGVKGLSIALKFLLFFF